MFLCCCCPAYTRCCLGVWQKDGARDGDRVVLTSHFYRSHKGSWKGTATLCRVCAIFCGLTVLKLRVNPISLSYPFPLPLPLVPRNRVVSARGENMKWDATWLLLRHHTSSLACCYVTRGDKCWSQTLRLKVCVWSQTLRLKVCVWSQTLRLKVWF